MTRMAVFVSGLLLAAVAWAVPPEPAAFFSHPLGQDWTPVEGADAKVLLRYPASHVLASGWLLGENRYAGKPALLTVRVGQGTVYLFGMRPQYRGQSYLTLKIFFNALLR